MIVNPWIAFWCVKAWGHNWNIKSSHKSVLVTGKEWKGLRDHKLLWKKIFSNQLSRGERASERESNQPTLPSLFSSSSFISLFSQLLILIANFVKTRRVSSEKKENKKKVRKRIFFNFISRSSSSDCCDLRKLKEWKRKKIIIGKRKKNKKIEEEKKTNSKNLRSEFWKPKKVETKQREKNSWREANCV